MSRSDEDIAQLEKASVTVICQMLENLNKLQQDEANEILDLIAESEDVTMASKNEIGRIVDSRLEAFQTAAMTQGGGASAAVSPTKMQTMIHPEFFS